MDSSSGENHSTRAVGPVNLSSRGGCVIVSSSAGDGFLILRGGKVFCHERTGGVE